MFFKKIFPEVPLSPENPRSQERIFHSFPFPDRKKQGKKTSAEANNGAKLKKNDFFLSLICKINQIVSY